MPKFKKKMSLPLTLIVVLSIVKVCFSDEVDGPKVEVNEGTLLGKVQQTRGGKKLYAFEGIPYAKPPLGPLRFQVSFFFQCSFILNLIIIYSTLISFALS